MEESKERAQRQVQEMNNIMSEIFTCPHSDHFADSQRNAPFE